MNSCLRLVAMLTLGFFSVERMYAQSSTSTDFYGTAADKQEICSNASSFMSEQEVERLIADILAMQGLNNRFIIIGCPSVSNCVATLDKDKRPVILFNPTFLRPVQKFQFKEADLPEVSERDWSTLTILAHEIGHHLNNHLTNPLPGVTRQQQELEADRTAGFLVFLMGGALEQAQLAFKEVREVASYTHPARTDRLTALARGWKDAEARFKKAEPVKPDLTEIEKKAENFFFRTPGNNGRTLGLEWYKKAADLGSVKAMLQLGDIYGGRVEYGSIPKDYQKAAQYFQMAAEKGSTEGMEHLAELYVIGWGVKENRNTAAEWYRKAADLGSYLAMKELGEYYEYHRKDPATAKIWYKKACETSGGKFGSGCDKLK